MEQNLINESRLFDELAELLLQLSKRCALLAQSRKNQQSPMTNVQSPMSSLPFLMPGKLHELGLYSCQQFETMYHNAATSNASVFAKFLKQYAKLGIFDFKGLNKTQIFCRLKTAFPNEIKYKYSNFTTYF